jgi:hypothetical protein
VDARQRMAQELTGSLPRRPAPSSPDISQTVIVQPVEWWATAIIAAVTGLGSGAVGSIIAPWSNWGVEKRRDKLTARRNQIAAWRKMVGRYVGQPGGGDQIIHDPDYASLRRHLKRERLARLEHSGHSAVFKQGAQGISADDKLSAVSDQIDDLERKWKLT